MSLLDAPSAAQAQTETRTLSVKALILVIPCIVEQHTLRRLTLEAEAKMDRF